MTAWPKREFRQEVTDDIVRLLEQGGALWQKPWTAQHSLSTPYNPTTEKPYRGGNILTLTIAAMQKRYDDPRWATYRQAANEGWQVRKGEKGTQIEFWDVQAGKHDLKDDSTEQRPESGDDRRFIHRVYTVFNTRQMDGPPAVAITRPTSFEIVEAGEKILKDSGANIFHDQADRAFYNRRFDTIHLPPRAAFPSAEAYYGTSIHELVHWTGHESRLNRETLNKSWGFSSTDEFYSREELIAEIGSMMLAAEKGIPHDPTQHAAYVGSWIKALKEDKNEVFVLLLLLLLQRTTFWAAAGSAKLKLPSSPLPGQHSRPALPTNNAAGEAANAAADTIGYLRIDPMDYRPHARNNSESDDLVTASELREFVFCQRAWWLKRKGYAVSRRAQTDQAAGIAFHEERARAARTATEGAALWLAIVLALLAIAIWFIKQFLEAHH